MVIRTTKYKNIIILDKSKPFRQGVEDIWVKNIKELTDKHIYCLGYMVGELIDRREEGDKVVIDIEIYDDPLNDMIRRETAYYKAVPRIDGINRTCENGKLCLNDATIFFISLDYATKLDCNVKYKEADNKKEKKEED